MATKKQTKVTTQPDNPTFLTGLTVGLFIGALGYYLFNTKKGEKMRSALMSEWEEVRKHLYAEGLLPSPDVTFNELISEHLTTLSGWFAEVAASEDSATAKKTSSRSREKFTGM